MTVLSGGGPEAQASRSERARATRILEIDGLRGIALLLVVLFHLFGQGRVSGGVDVFLTVSGLLLTLSLAGAVSRDKPLRLWRRASRIFMRLAPPAAVVLIAVLLMNQVLLSPWSRIQNLTEIVASALYFENWELIASQLSYGAAGPLTSPVQHFWSLSVQGQFFIAWPLVTALIAVLLRRSRWRMPVFWSFVGCATIASFVYATIRNGENPDRTYFDSFARFWELGAGALAARAVMHGTMLPRVLRPVIGWLGLGAILVSGFVVDGASAYPGPLALIPVLGAVLVVLSAGSTHPASAAAVLRSRPLTMLDRVSYELYLWHWPILICYLAITGGTSASQEVSVIDGPGAALVLALSVAAAVITRVLISRPIERVLARSPRPAAAMMAPLAAVLIVTVPAGVILTSYSAASTPSPSAIRGSCLGAAALDPERPECAGQEHERIAPPLEVLRGDDGNRPECWAGESGELRICSLGPETGYSRHLIAVGDSHNNALIAAYDEIAQERGWRIDVAGHGGCFWTEAIREQGTQHHYDACASWQQRVTEHVAQQRGLDGIIVTHSARPSFDVPEGGDLVEYRAQGLVDAWASRSDPGIPILAIRDAPSFTPDDMECMTGPDPQGCSAPRNAAIRDEGFADAVGRDPNAHLIDLTDKMCTATRCGLIVGGVVVSRDGAHLTETYSLTLVPYLERELVAALD